MVAGSTSPARTAATSESPQGPTGPGITRSSAARADASVERVANQSDMTSPSNPSSRWRRSRSSLLSVIGSPLTPLYAAITDQTPASRTIASNGARYSSRSVRSSTRASSVIRSVSESLATKCLTVAPTPASWIPHTKLTPIRAVRSGSSLKHSKCRPPYGVRWRLTVGASTTSTPLRRASDASSPPSCSTSSSSHVAASAVGEGTFADGSRSSHRSPRTPAGPSETIRRRRPTAGSGCSDQKSAPVSRRTFCSSDSDATRAASSDSSRVGGAAAEWVIPGEFLPVPRGAAQTTFGHRERDGGEGGAPTYEGDGRYVVRRAITVSGASSSVGSAPSPSTADSRSSTPRAPVSRNG